MGHFGFRPPLANLGGRLHDLFGRWLESTRDALAAKLIRARMAADFADLPFVLAEIQIHGSAQFR